VACRHSFSATSPIRREAAPENGPLYRHVAMTFYEVELAPAVRLGIARGALGQRSIDTARTKDSSRLEKARFATAPWLQTTSRQAEIGIRSARAGFCRSGQDLEGRSRLVARSPSTIGIAIRGASDQRHP